MTEISPEEDARMQKLHGEVISLLRPMALDRDADSKETLFTIIAVLLGIVKDIGKECSPVMRKTLAQVIYRVADDLAGMDV